MSKHLLVVAADVPWPSNHGLRVDIWHRYKALKNHGWRISLLCWYAKGEQEPTNEDRSTLMSVFSNIYCYPKPSGLSGLAQRLLRLPFMSTHVSGRLLSDRVIGSIAVKMADAPPDIVMLDSIYGYPAAQNLASTLDVPMVLRSHNIEHRYMRQQCERALTLRARIQLSMAAAHLESFETKVHRASAWVFDISCDDLSFWRRRGFVKNSWLPTITKLPSPSAGDTNVSPDFDFVYVGNLNTPNNIQGITWLFDLVLPLLAVALPHMRLLIAGSHPTPEITALVASCPFATLLANVPDASAVRRRGRVLINPILSGSGLNVKSIEMLHEGLPVVTTPVGVQGLPSDLKAAFRIAETPADFANRMREALDISPSRNQAAKELCASILTAQFDDFNNRLLRLVKPTRSA